MMCITAGLQLRRVSRVGAVVRALASHQCVPGSIPGPGVICGLSLLLVLYSAPRGFSPGTLVFPSHQKPTLLNSNSIWKQWMKSHLVEMPLQIPLLLLLVLVSLIKTKQGRREGGAVASWLVHASPDQVVWVGALAGDIALFLWARHWPLSTQMYKWVLANLMLG